MSLVEHPLRRIRATVLEVLPMTGLAYVADEGTGTWTITKSTQGVGLDTLRQGQRVELTIRDDNEYSIVSGYAPLD